MTIEKLESYNLKKEKIPFTYLSNAVLQKLNDAEILGVWCYLSSLPENWKIIPAHIRKHFGFGRHKIESIFARLKKLGLIEYHQDRSEGKFSETTILLRCGFDFSMPEENAAPPETGDTDTAPPVSGDTDTAPPENRSPGLPLPRKSAAYKDYINNKGNKERESAETLSNFEPNQEHLEFAQEFNIPIMDEYVKFLHHQKAKGIFKSNDLNAAFSLWLMRSKQYKQLKGKQS